MAERRMFAKTIIGSARFLRMPVSARLLYYDLGMEADDDGCVEAFGVMRKTGAAEDDLRVLVAKGFVKILNDDLVSYILDWNVNNSIRKDRYHAGIYKQLIETECPISIEAQHIETICQPTDNQMTTEVRLGKDRLGKDRLGKDRLGKDRLGKDRLEEHIADEVSPECPFSQIEDLYHKLCPSYPQIVGINGNRKKAVAARWRIWKTLDTFTELFEKAEESDFLKGKNDRNWHADFDWMMKATNADKILEGKYASSVSKPASKPGGAMAALKQMWENSDE